MGKLTNFQIENKLIKMVEYNDFEVIEQFLNENPYDINKLMAKKYDTLLGLAITNKSKETFDFLINYPGFNVHLKYPKLDLNCIVLNDYMYDSEDDDDEEFNNLGQADNNQNVDSDDEIENDDEKPPCHNYSVFSYNRILGVERALQIYLNAPNFPNSHYLRSMINHNFLITPDILCRLDKYPELYNGILAKNSENTNYLICLLLNKVQYKQDIDTIWEKVKDNLDINCKTRLFRHVINSGQSSYIKKFFTNPENFYVLNDNNNMTHILTWVIYNMVDNQHMEDKTGFNILLENIRTAPITNINLKLLTKNIIYGRYSQLLLDNFEQLKQLDFNEDLSPHLIYSLKKQFKSSYDRINWTNLNLFIKLGWCKSNLINLLTFTNEEIKEFNYADPQSVNKILYMLVHHNMKPDLEFFCKYFKFSLDDFADNKIKLWFDKNVEEIDKPKTKNTTDVKNTKTKKRTKKTNKELEV